MILRNMIILLIGSAILGYGVDNLKMIYIIPGACLMAIGILNFIITTGEE